MIRQRTAWILSACCSASTGCTLPNMYSDWVREAGATGGTSVAESSKNTLGVGGAKTQLGGAVNGGSDDRPNPSGRWATVAGAGGVSPSIDRGTAGASFEMQGGSAGNGLEVYSITAGGGSGGSAGDSSTDPEPIGGMTSTGFGSSGGSLASAGTGAGGNSSAGGIGMGGSAFAGSSGHGGMTERTSVVSPTPLSDATQIPFRPQDTYKGIAVSATYLFLLKSEGSTEVRDRINPGTLLFSSGTNFTALAYASGWGLIAARDWDESRGVFISALGGATPPRGDYPPGMEFVTDLAAFEQPHVPESLRICVIGYAPKIPPWLQCGTYTVGSSTVIEWDAETYAPLPNSRGLTAMVEDGIGYLIRQEFYPSLRLLRFAAPNGPVQYERLTSGDAHGYATPDLGTVELDMFAPVDLDYSEELGRFYAVDDCSDAKQGIWRQCLVTLERENVVF